MRFDIFYLFIIYFTRGKRGKQALKKHRFPKALKVGDNRNVAWKKFDHSMFL